MTTTRLSLFSPSRRGRPRLRPQPSRRQPIEIAPRIGVRTGRSRLRHLGRADEILLGSPRKIAAAPGLTGAPPVPLSRRADSAVPAGLHQAVVEGEHHGTGSIAEIELGEDV